MASRPQNLQKRGNVWWLRVRVPDDLRPIIGRREVRRSLRTIDATEAKKLVRGELIRVDAQFDAARRLRDAAQTLSTSAKPAALSQAEVWALTARFFSQAEQEARLAPALSPVDLDDSYEEQSRLEDYDQAAPTVHQAVRNVLKTAGIDYSAIPGPIVPPWLLQLHHGIHAAMVDSGRRHLNRSDSAAGLPLNPAFSGITGQTALQPVANLAFADLVRRYESDRARAPLSPKAAEKRQAQLKFLTEVIGARTPVSFVDREAARKVFDAVGRMPANAAKRFPRKSVADLLALPPDKVGARLSTVTANGYMVLFGSVMEFAVAEHIIDLPPPSGPGVMLVQGRSGC